MLDFYVCRTRVGNSTFVGFNHAVIEQCAHYKAAFDSDKDCLCRREFWKFGVVEFVNVE